MMATLGHILKEIDPRRVIGYLEPEVDDLRERFMKIFADAPIELEGERHLGQDHPESYCETHAHRTR